MGRAFLALLRCTIPQLQSACSQTEDVTNVILGHQNSPAGYLADDTGLMLPGSDADPA